MHEMVFRIGGRPVACQVTDVVIAGWTGRDARVVEAHIEELARIGVARPRTTPCFYRVGSNLLTQADRIDVLGAESSGEVEFVLLSLEQGLHVGLGSDHTDRKVEAYDVAVSKQACPKPIGGDLWSFEDVRSHWDRLVLRSWVIADGKRELYQEGSVASMLAPADLVARYPDGGKSLPKGTAMFCGTLPLLGGIKCAKQLELELEDPREGRRLAHAYEVRTLPHSN